MAYEGMTYELILKRMMARVSLQYPNIDTREGSILFNALAPAALELTIAYNALNNVLSESFVATASREYLMRACSQVGMDISSFYASNGYYKAKFDAEIPLGSRWNHDIYNYVVFEKLNNTTDDFHWYKLYCETAGSAPNAVTGTITPIDVISNDLTIAEITECIIEGEDESSEDEIRTAYYNYVGNSVIDGNVKQYEQWCQEYDGVGNYRIFPLWNGDNTVKVSILSTSNRAASEELVEQFQEYIDPNSEGMGNGVAPIGAKVTVSTATEIPISVGATIKMRTGYTDTKPIEDALSNYFAYIAYQNDTVPYMNIGAVILAVDGVESVNDLTLNGETEDYTLSTEEIPTLGETSLVVT